MDADLAAQILKKKDPVLNWSLAREYFSTSAAMGDHENLSQLIRIADALTIEELKKVDLRSLKLGIFEPGLKKALSEKTQAKRLEELDKAPNWKTRCWAIFH